MVALAWLGRPGTLPLDPSLLYICVGIGAVAIWANANLYLQNLGLELLEQSLMPKGFWPAFSQMISTEFGVSFTAAIWTVGPAACWKEQDYGPSAGHRQHRDRSASCDSHQRHQLSAGPPIDAGSSVRGHGQ